MKEVESICIARDGVSLGTGMFIYFMVWLYFSSYREWLEMRLYDLLARWLYVVSGDNGVDI